MEKKQWFPHDQDSRHDPKIRYILKKFGLEGYARFFILLESLRSEEGYKIKNTPLSIEILAEDWMMPDKDAVRFLGELASAELIQFDEQFIFCKNLADRMKPYDDKLLNSKTMAQKRWDKFRKMNNTEKIIARDPMLSPNGEAINVDIVGGYDDAPDGYMNFELGVVRLWNSIAVKHKGMSLVSTITELLRERLMERFKESEFIEKYPRILRHIDANPFYHEKSKTGVLMSLATLVQDKETYMGIVTRMSGYDKGQEEGQGSVEDVQEM